MWTWHHGGWGWLCCTHFNVFVLMQKTSDKCLRLNSLSTKPCIGLCLEKISPLEGLEIVLPARTLFVPPMFHYYVCITLKDLEDLYSSGHYIEEWIIHSKEAYAESIQISFFFFPEGQLDRSMEVFFKAIFFLWKRNKGIMKFKKTYITDDAASKLVKYLSIYLI